MLKKRLIARLDVKGENLIKGINLEGLRVVGKPAEFAQRYCEQGIDELVYIDSVASLYGRNNLHEVVSQTAEQVFIPITVGGGVRSVADAKKLILAGADKIAINTAAVQTPELLSEIAQVFGAQAVVLSVQAVKTNDDAWEVFVENGRQQTGLDVISWINQAIGLGAGEILLTSVDQEGTETGMDLDLIKKVTEIANVPVIASGGVGHPNHVSDALEQGVDAVAVASLLHYKKSSIKELKSNAKDRGFAIRAAV